MLLPLNEYLDALCGHVIDIARENRRALYVGQGGCYYRSGEIVSCTLRDGCLHLHHNLPCGCIIGQADRRMGKHAIFTNPERHTDETQQGFISVIRRVYKRDDDFPYPAERITFSQTIECLRNRLNIQMWACVLMQYYQDKRRTWGTALDLVSPYFTHLGYDVTGKTTEKNIPSN